MPKDFKFISSLRALADRPLIWLLPFYMAGIYLGWRLDGYGPGAEGWLTYGLGAAGLLILVQIKDDPPFPEIAFALLAPLAVLALGWGLTARSLTEPTEANHLLNFTEEAGWSQPVILGGYVAEGSGGRPDRNYRLIIDAAEIIVPGDDGPEKVIATVGRARLGLGGRLAVREGDYLRLPVTLRRLNGFRNPGSEDYEKHWAAQGVWVGGFVKSPQLAGTWPDLSRAGLITGWRDRAATFIEERVPVPAAGILAAQLVGRREAVDEDREEAFRLLGLSHLLAVSGLHLGVCYGACFWLLRLILRRLPSPIGAMPRLNLAAAALAVIPALMYAALVGAASPVVRAAVMIFFVTLAAVALRRSDPWNILAAAAWVLLLAQPFRLFSASFQLSFVATAAMLAVFVPRPGAPPPPKSRPGFWTRPVSPELCRQLISRIKGESPAKLENQPEGKPEAPTFLTSAFKAALAGTLGTLPLVVWHFGQVSVAGVLANLIFPFIFSFLILIPGLAAMALLPFSPELAAGPLALSGLVLSALLPILERLAAVVPEWMAPAPGIAFFIGWYLASWIILRSPRPLKTRAALAAAILILGLLPGRLDPPGDRGVLRFTVLDVGQGSSIHLGLPDGRQMLVDGGGGYNFDPGEALIKPYLLRQGFSRLDVIALTHPDQDHLKGLVTVAGLFRPREIWTAPWPEDLSPLYQSFLTVSPGSARPPLAEFRPGRDFGPARVETLWPPADLVWPDQAPGGNWINDHGLVLRVVWDEISFLITGDIGRETERRLIALHGPALQSTVLVAPHHGSRNSLTPEFLAAVAPDWVVFAAGRNNSFGLPHPEAVQRARDQGAEIWRTDLSGAAVFEARPAGATVRLEGPGR